MLSRAEAGLVRPLYSRNFNLNKLRLVPWGFGVLGFWGFGDWDWDWGLGLGIKMLKLENFT